MAAEQGWHAGRDSNPRPSGSKPGGDASGINDLRLSDLVEPCGAVWSARERGENGEMRRAYALDQRIQRMSILLGAQPLLK